MNNGNIVHYVITVEYKEEGLTDLNELNNQLTRGGFGLTSSQSLQEVEQLAQALGHVALGFDPKVTVTTLEEWKKSLK